MSEGEEKLCNDLHNGLYGADRSIQQWRWEFTGTLQNGMTIPYAVVEDNGKIVGTQALIPIRMIDSEGTFWSAKSEDALLAPEYRGRGLHEKLYDLMLDFAGKQDIQRIWGFTPAVKAFERLGHDFPGKTGQLFIPFSVKSIPIMMAKSSVSGQESPARGTKVGLMQAAAVLARSWSAVKTARSRRPSLRGVTIETVEYPDERMADLCRRFVAKWGGATIYRDARYMQWRLFDNPYVKSVVRAAYRDSRLLGWVAYTLGDDGMGYIVDLITASNSDGVSDADLIRALLVEAVVGTRNMGASGIRGWHVNDHPFDRLLLRAAKKVGFYYIRRGGDFHMYVIDSDRSRSREFDYNSMYINRLYTEGTLG